jgi:hypothetical protein
MTFHNAPNGWAAFREFRQQPMPVRRRHHGNCRHGMRSKEGIAGMRLIRLRSRIWDGRFRYPPQNMPASFFPPRPLGWAAYRATRDGLPAPAPEPDMSLRTLLRIIPGG